MNILFILCIIFGTVIMVYLMSLIDLSRLISGVDDEKEREKENDINAWLMLVFGAAYLLSVVYMMWKYEPYLLPVSASEHGVTIDNLMTLNWWILGVVFFATHILLFWFAYKYKFSKDRRAFFYPENNKLELIWTVIPTIVLAVVIYTGLKAWNDITQSDNDDGMVVEVYGKQFDWTARYSGKDNVLGASNFRMIADDNPLGVDRNDKASKDDIITREIHLPKGIPVEFKFNSRDVIHSAYFPHFRAQMNCVPGMTTSFYMVPTITTEEMREITGNKDFNYILLCNKICGVAHFNMKMNVVVEEPAEFKKWLRNEKLVFQEVEDVEEEIDTPAETSEDLAAIVE